MRRWCRLSSPHLSPALYVIKLWEPNYGIMLWGKKEKKSWCKWVVFYDCMSVSPSVSLLFSQSFFLGCIYFGDQDRICSHKSYTVEPVYNHRPSDWSKVVVIDRWSPWKGKIYRENKILWGWSFWAGDSYWEVVASTVWLWYKSFALVSLYFFICCIVNFLLFVGNNLWSHC